MPSFTAFASALAPVSPDNPALAAAQAKPNKGIILRKSVEYIRQLQQFLDMQMNRNSALEWELQQQYEARAGEPHAAPPPGMAPMQENWTGLPPAATKWNTNQKHPANEPTSYHTPVAAQEKVPPAL